MVRQVTSGVHLGLNTTLAKTSANSFPFGLWFANADTLYVADEGNGTATYSGGQYTVAAAHTTAGFGEVLRGVSVTPRTRG
jgi:hypothetical protein